MEKIVKTGQGEYVEVDAAQAQEMISNGTAWDPTVHRKFVKLRAAWNQLPAGRIVGYLAHQEAEMNALIAAGTAEAWPPPRAV